MQRRTIAFFITCFLSSALVSAQSALTGKKEMASDLLFLKQQLYLRHPNLYEYSSQEEVNSWFNTTISNLPDSVSQTNAFLITASIAPVLMDGHSYVYPGDYFLKSFFGDGVLFPFDVVWLEDSLRIVRDLSDEQSLNSGDVILGINGITAQHTKEFIVNHLSRDGRNSAYAEYLFTSFIQAWLAAFYNFPVEFNLKVFKKGSGVYQVKIKGLRRNEIRIKRELTDQYSGRGIRLYVDSHSRSAYMTIQSFSNDIIRAEYNQSFKKEMRFFFERLNRDSIQRVYIDLRGNQGGELSNGIYLLRYIMDVPFKVVESFARVRINKNKERELIEFRNKWTSDFDCFKKNQFKGKVIFLTDGGSFSCSSIVANVIKKHGRGEIWGGITGGSSRTLAGGPLKKIRLPNSGVEFSIPRTKYSLNSSLSSVYSDGGVKPDRIIAVSIEEILMNDRERLSYFNHFN
ncbi:MAG: S41 family peptidase [Bacteroidia bacterium]